MMMFGPGFRFHPTDEELVAYYLKRKINRTLPFRFDKLISFVHVYKSDPWDLLKPGLDDAKSNEVEWYFFSALDTKYGNGSRTNRATPNGYWKTTGKDRPVYAHNAISIGMKKTLVFHSGRAPHGARTHWVMHEYRLLSEKDDAAAFVLCRLFQKNGTIPPCPFLEEEEWDSDNDHPVSAPIPGEHVQVPGDAYFQTNHPHQKVDISITPENDPFLLDFCFGGNNNNCVEEAIVNDQKQLVIGISEDNYTPELPDVNLFTEAGNQLNEPYFDATGNVSFDGGLFLEANYNLEECLSYFDADTGNLSFDSSKMIATESSVSGQGFSDQQVNGGTEHLAMRNEQFMNACGDDGGPSTSSDKKSPCTRLDSDIEYSFAKQRATLMLEGISAPPAFASEFPSTKDAQIIQMRRNNMNRNGLDFSFGKNRTLGLILSFALPQKGHSNDTLFSSFLLFGKTSAAISRGLFCLMFIWVLVLSMSYKM